MIGAVIFDLDGLLVDSERLWCQSEMRCFGAAGIKLDEELCRQTVGMRVDEVVQHWYARQTSRFPSAVLPPATDMAERIVADVTTRLHSVPTKPGAEAAVRFCADRGVTLGIASSSPYSLIEAALAGTGLGTLFDVIHSAADEEYGKPNPAVYLTAAAKLGVAPTNCLAIEDALAGVIAAKAARMRCVAVPESIPAAAGFAVADQVLTSLTEFGPAIWAALGGA